MNEEIIYCPECGAFVETVIADEVVEMECPLCQHQFTFEPSEVLVDEDLY